MAKSTEVKLTKTVIDAAKPQATRYTLWDSETTGFGLRIGVGGVKTFVVRYLAPGGGRRAPRRFVTIGRFGMITVEQARRKAKETLAAVLMGHDPANERNKKRKELFVSELIDLYEEEGCFIQRGKRQGQPMKPMSKKLTINRLRHHVVPLLGNKRLSEVGATELERFHRDVGAGKTAKNELVAPRTRIIVRGGEGAARKTFRDLSAVFSFAKRRSLVSENPCEKAVVRKTDNVRTRFLTIEEIMRLGAACSELEAEGENAKAINIARLWALTGCRRQEIAELKWSEVDFEHGVLILDDTKTGKSRRPLANAAMALLKSIGRTEGSDYVFPADTGDSYFQGTKRIWAKIVKRAELPGVTPHTLRHTLGSTATSTGEALAITGAILGHANIRSTMIYAHVQDDPSRRAADRVGKKIAAALAGEIQPAKTRSSRKAQTGGDKSRAGLPGVAGMLPEAEWFALDALAAQAGNEAGYLASATSAALLGLEARGFVERDAPAAEQMSVWRINAIGLAMIGARNAEAAKIGQSTAGDTQAKVPNLDIAA